MLSQQYKVYQDISLSPKLRDSVSLFGALTDIQVETLLAYATTKILKSGDRLFNQGDLPDEVCIVVSGRVDLVVHKHGIYSLEATFQAGDSLGETALIGIQPQVGSAIVVGEYAEFITFPKDVLLSLYEDDLELYGVLMMNIAREVSRKLHCLMKSE